MRWGRIGSSVSAKNTIVRSDYALVSHRTVAKRLPLKNGCQRTELFLNAFHFNLLKAKPMKLKS